MAHLRSVEGGGEGDSEVRPDPLPWEDATSFHTKGRESHSVVLTVRVPQATARAISRIVQSGQFPGLETVSDAVRDATWRWTRWMATIGQDEELMDQLDIQKSNWKMASELHRHQQQSETVDTAEKLLETNGIGERTRRRVLTELCQMAIRMDEDSELRKRISHLVEKYKRG